MAWQPQTVFPGNPIKASEFNVLQDNIIAQANGDIGAPKQKQAGIDAAAVGQDQLKTSISNYSFSPPTADDTNILLAGGQYGFLPVLQRNTGVGVQGISVSIYDDFTAEIVAACYIYIQTQSTLFGRPLNISQRYVNASPPYDLGDGCIAQFNFVKLDAQGSTIAAYSADVPPWAYNGPTKLTPDRLELTKEGILKKYKTVMVNKPLPPWEGGDLELWQKGPHWQEIEIDNCVKNADMSLLPHPFGKLREGERVLIIEPCSDLNVQLNGIIETGESVTEMITKGYIELGDTVNCCTPPGVTAVRAKWKNNGG